MCSLFATYFTLGLRPSFDLGMNEEIIRLLSVVPIIDLIDIGEKSCICGGNPCFRDRKDKSEVNCP